MGSSKGIGLKARDVKDLLPAELARFLFCRSDYKQAVEFDPIGTMAIPDLFDEYDRCYLSYIEGSDEDLARTFEMSQIDEISPKEKTHLPRFRDVVNYIQLPNVDIFEKFAGVDKEILEERIKYAKIWLEKYAPDEFKINLSETLPEMAKDLSEDQKNFLKKAVELIEEENDPEALQLALYNLTKEMKVDAKKSFSAIYISLIGKQFGPKAAWFLLSLPKEKVIGRLKEVTV